MSIELSKIIESVALSVNTAKKEISSEENYSLDLEEADVTLTLNTELDPKSVELKRSELKFNSILQKKDLRTKPTDFAKNQSSTTIRLIFNVR